MTIKQKFVSRCQELNAEIVGTGNDIEVEAPRGMVWSGIGTHAIVAAPERDDANRPITPRTQLYKWLLEDMSYGLEKCQTKDCEWCNGVM
jgi:hypothetical protein